MVVVAGGFVALVSVAVVDDGSLVVEKPHRATHQNEAEETWVVRIVVRCHDETPAGGIPAPDSTEHTATRIRLPNMFPTCVCVVLWGRSIFVKKESPAFAAVPVIWIVPPRVLSKSIADGALFLKYNASPEDWTEFLRSQYYTTYV